MGTTRQARIIFRTLLVLTAVVQFWAILIYHDFWHYNNDPLNILSSGINVDVDEPLHKEFKKFAETNCKNNYSGDVEYCVSYQNVLTTNIYYNYPITSIFGSWLATSDVGKDFLAKAAKVLVAATLTSVAAAAILGVTILWNASSVAQLGYSALTGGAFFSMRFFRGRGDLDLVSLTSLENFQTISWTFGICIAIGVASAILVRWPKLFEHEGAWNKRFLIISISITVLLLALRVLNYHDPLLQSLVVVLAFTLLIVLLRAKNVDWLLICAAVLIFWVCFNEGSFVLTVQHNRSLATIVILAGLALAASGRNSSAIWLMPLAALLHVSVAGLVGIILLITETIVCIFQRRVTPLWFVALAMAAIGIGFNQLTSASELTTFDSSQLPLILPYLDNPHFFHGLIGGIIFGSIAAAILLWQQKEGEWLARACLYLAALAILSGLSIGLTEQDQTLFFRNGWYAFTWFNIYLGPPLLNAAIVVTLVWLLQKISEPAKTTTIKGTAEIRSWAPQVMVLCVFTALVAAQSSAIGGARLNLYKLGKNSILQIAGERLPRLWKKEFSALGRDTNLLVVSREYPKNHPAMYFSLLKLRMLLARGQANPNTIRFGYHEDTR